MTKRKKYTKEFKEEAAKLVIEGGYTQAEASKNLGVGNKNLSRWVAQAKGTNTQQQTKTTESVELSRLKKENQQLKLEREILKKAAAFFANEHK
jgi:transposase